MRVFRPPTDSKPILARFFTFNTARLENMIWRDDPTRFFGQDI